MEIRPKARNSEIVVQEVAGETLVYDLKTNRAKCLNETSAVVWKLCDGTRNAIEISMAMSAQLKVNVDENYVLLALDQLNKEELLDLDGHNSIEFSGVSRREVIKKIGFAAVIALPVVSSVIAPRAASAQSGLQPCVPGAGVLCTCAQGGANQGVNSCRAAVNSPGVCYLQSDVRCTAGNECPPNQPNGTKCCVIDSGPSGDPNNCPPTV